MSFSSLNCTKCVSHRGICIGNESLFSRHGLRPSIFSGPVSIDRERVINGQWDTNISAFASSDTNVATNCKTFDTEYLKLPWKIILYT